MELEIRQAKESDLARVQAMYARLVARMDRDGWNVWSDTYPRDAVGEDIKKGWFYLLLAGETLCGAFALPPQDEGEGDVPWRDSSAPARYLYRFGIAVEYRAKGLGKLALGKIEELCGALGARYLRLYVAYENEPALALYRKAGFVQLPGEFGEFLLDGTRLFEYAFEKRL